MPRLLARTALIFLIGVIGPAQAADDSIGLALDKLRLHMTMAEARAAYPALGGDPQMGLLSGTYELDGCSFLLALEFARDSLIQVELDTATNVETCKMAVMQRILSQYGASQKGCPIWANSIYSNLVGPLEIYVTDNRAVTPGEYVRGPDCPAEIVAPMGTAGVSGPTIVRHLGIIFHAAGSGIAIFQ